MPPAVRVAASTLARRLLTGDAAEGHVLGAFPTACYLQLAGDVLVLEAVDALRLPGAVVVPAPSAVRPFGQVRAGDVARVEDGALSVGVLGCVVVRWWQPRRPRPAANREAYDDRPLSAVAALLPSLSPPVATRLAGLVDALGAGADPAAQVGALLGLGQGLTPEADDVLSGMLVALSDGSPSPGPGVDATSADGLRFAVRRLAPSRTTALSAALLAQAADGYAVPALLDLVDALHQPPSSVTTPEGVRRAVVRLLAVGHTSGAALARGALAGARLRRAATARSEVA